MGSRIIHLAIAKRIFESLKLDEDRFNLGSLIPDAHKGGKEKVISHYQLKDAEFGDEQYIDFDLYLARYQAAFDDHLYLGYYAHLLADNHWLKHIYAKTMVDENNQIKTELQDTYYLDYEQMNRLLIDHYQLESEVTFTNYAIDEININQIPKIKKSLKSDFRSKHTSTDFKILFPEMVIDHIETVSKLCINEIMKVGNDEIIK